MSMSRRDYQALARAIHDASVRHCGAVDCGLPFELLSGDVMGCVLHGIRAPMWVTACGLKRAVIDRVADVLAADSPRFDRARFVEACETGTTRGMKR